MFQKKSPNEKNVGPLNKGVYDRKNSQLIDTDSYNEVNTKH